MRPRKIVPAIGGTWAAPPARPPVPLDGALAAYFEAQGVSLAGFYRLGARKARCLIEDAKGRYWRVESSEAPLAVGDDQDAIDDWIYDDFKTNAEFDTLRRALIALDRVTKEFNAALREAHPHVGPDYIAGKYRLYRQAPVGWLFNRTSSVEVDAILASAHAHYEAGCT